MHPELIHMLFKMTSLPISVLFSRSLHPSFTPLFFSLYFSSYFSSHVLKLQSQLSLEQRNAALPSVPSLLEVCGFSYFYGGFLVGPQFTLRSYQRLVAGELTDCPGKPPNR